MLTTKQLIGFLNLKSQHPKAGIDSKAIGVYMKILDYGPVSATPKLNDVEINIADVGRSAYMRYSAVVDLLQKFKQIGAITSLRQKSVTVYIADFAKLD
jgi:hypothetical protein